MSNSLMIFLSQLLSMSPTLLVCLGGMIVAGMWWRRAPRPAMFAMGGLGIILLGMLVSPLIQVYVVSNRRTATATTIGNTVAVMSMALSILRAAGMGLLIAGIFSSRPRIDAGFPLESHTGEPPSPPLANLAPDNSER